MFRVTSSSVTTTCSATLDLPGFSVFLTLHIFRCNHVRWQLKFFLEKNISYFVLTKIWHKTSQFPLLLCSADLDAYSWERTTQIKTKTNAQDLDIFLYFTLLREHLDWVITLEVRCRKIQHLILLYQNVALIPHKRLIWLPSISQISKSLIHGSLLQVLGQLKYQSV